MIFSPKAWLPVCAICISGLLGSACATPPAAQHTPEESLATEGGFHPQPAIHSPDSMSRAAISPASLTTTAAAASGSDAKSGTETLEKTSEAFQKVAQKALPVVVSIRAVKIGSSSPHESMGTNAGPPMPGGPSPFAGPGMPGAPGPEDGTASLGIGSGVIIRTDGTILTNNHVVENAEKITVGIGEHDKFKAHVIGTDSKTDIALIKLDEKPKDLQAVTFANSDQVQVGDWAVAIGSPFGLTHTVTSGIVSAKGRGQMGVYDIEDFIQTDAAINPGNSGGPLLNLRGEMIGLNAAIFSQSGGFIGIGFSIASNLAKQVADDILAHGHVVRGWMGVVAQDMDPDLSKYFKVPTGKGALISTIDPKGPGAKGDLQVGDVVTKFNHEPVTGSTHLRALVGQTKGGTQVPIEIVRNGAPTNLIIPIQQQPFQNPSRQQAGIASFTQKREKPTLGILLQDIPDELTPALGTGPGTGALVVGVKPGGPAFEAGLAPGDVVLKANNTKVRNANELSALIQKMGDEASVFYIQRGPGKRLFVPLKVTD